MGVRPQVMPDLLPQQSSSGHPVTGMTRMSSTEDVKQKLFMSFGFSVEAGATKQYNCLRGHLRGLDCTKACSGKKNFKNQTFQLEVRFKKREQK